MQGHCPRPPPAGRGGRRGGRAGCRPLLVPAEMTGVATPRLLPSPAAPGREVLPWLRKRRPFRKTSSCRVQSGGAGGARAAGRDENRLGGSWMEARATLFWGETGVPQRHPGPWGSAVLQPLLLHPLTHCLSPASPHTIHLTRCLHPYLPSQHPPSPGAHLDVEGRQRNVGPPRGTAEAELLVGQGLRLRGGVLAGTQGPGARRTGLPPLEGRAGQAHVAVRLDEVGLQGHVPRVLGTGTLSPLSWPSPAGDRRPAQANPPSLLITQGLAASRLPWNPPNPCSSARPPARSHPVLELAQLLPRPSPAAPAMPGSRVLAPLGSPPAPSTVSRRGDAVRCLLAGSPPTAGNSPSSQGTEVSVTPSPPHPPRASIRLALQLGPRTKPCVTSLMSPASLSSALLLTSWNLMPHKRNPSHVRCSR